MTKGELRDIQLTRVVAEELNFILAGANDPLLALLKVSDVQSGKGAAHFIVLLVVDDTSEGVPRAEDVTRALERSKGFLRAELAQGLNLKRAPELTLMLDPRCPLTGVGP